MSTEKVEEARRLAYRAHKGQVDKAGRPYTEHLEYVAAHVETDAEKCVAYLHDVMEDTDYPPEEIEAVFGPEIYQAVYTMTHRSGEDYFDYVRRVSQNPLARRVKLADLTNNMMLERLPAVTEADRNRARKYQKAYDILSDMRE
ncbi:MAG: HD domain-containing protein [Oscillospiraceae bacterium]|nr:HD domain-containing protein [Oscillospiraceae bacterium]